MRTTVDLPETLLATAKARAARQGLTLSQFVEESVRDALVRDKAPPPARPFKLVTFGTGGLLPGLSWARLKDANTREDAGRFHAFRAHDAGPEDE
jgi:hypothetical protein